MIKFNNFPPRKPGDVELTEAALVQLQEYGTVYPGNQDYLMYRNMIQAFGQAIGHTVLSSVDDPDSIRAIMSPVFEDARSVMLANKVELEAGFFYAVDRAQLVEGAAS